MVYLKHQKTDIQPVVLIIEDHEAVRRGLRKLLELEFSQIYVIEAASGEEGVQRSLLESPQLIVMDISLPGMNGIEATRQIRKMHPYVPIVIFTVHEDEIYRAEASAAGASAYVSKRTMQTDLTAKLSAYLKQKARTTDSMATKH